MTRFAGIHTACRSALLAAVVGWLALSAGQTPASAQAAIAFVQVNYATPQSPQASVAAPYASAQTAGNLNVVVVGWNDTTAQVTSVSDTSGNIYTRAVGPTVRSGLGTQSIYYAKNILTAAATANTVTVTFNVPAQYVDLRLAEYRGIDNAVPVDVVAGASGSGTTSNSGSVTTTNANDLLVGANLIGQGTVAAGTGYTSRVITTPDSDILEDRVVTAVGSYNATARTTGGPYVMQMVAFRAAGSLVDTQPPTAPAGLTATAASSTQVTLSWTASTDNVAVTGYRIERCLGSGCSGFAQIGTATTTTFSDNTAAGSNTYSYRVRANDAAANLSGYSNTASATTPAPPDTQAPTVPGSLVASAVSSSQINLTWTASTDNAAVTNYLLERCQGTSCANFTQITAINATSFGDSGLTASTAYRYRVRATDAAGNLSGYSNIGSATTLAAPDTQPPTAPTNLVASPVSETQINLSWSPSTDNVGVTSYRIEQCQGAGCSIYTQIGTTAGTTFPNVGLGSATTYSYRVLATDLASNLSPYSNVATATTNAPDTQAPTAPSNLVATPVSTSQINLSWTASTDNVGVTNYLIEQCQGTGCTTFTQIATAVGTTFSNTGLASGTSYSYRVRATDAAGNLSSYSGDVSASTNAPDTQAPTAPGNLTANAISSSQINLSWAASTDNVNVTNYLIERCQGPSCSSFAQVGTSTGLTFNNTGLSGGVSYSYRVRATDAANNLSAYSATATASTPAAPAIAFVQVNSAVPQTSQASVAVPFTQPQTAGNLNVVVVGWNSSSGSVASVTDTRGNGYALAVGPTVVLGFATQNIYYAPSIGSAAANANTVTVTFSGAVPYADIRIAEYSGIAPVSPVDVVAVGQGSGAASTSASVSTTNPNDLIVGANIVSSLTTGPGASFTSRVITAPDGDILEDRIVSSVGSYNATAPIASGTWIMQMVAFKAGVSTPDTQPPTAPGSLVATPISGTQISLTWSAASDNIGITGYRIERCQGSSCFNFAEIAAPATTATTYVDTTVLSSTAYNYRVRATDAAGNLGPYSNVANATTLAPDTEPPSAPGTLVASAVSGTQIDVSWGAAVDNVGVAGYRLERCEGAGCTVFNKLGTTITGTSFSDTSLNINTTYNYIVRAQDAAGNLGAYSNVATATTLSTNPQLVAAYSFDEGTGTSVSDLSGHANNGTIANGTWTQTGKFGKALVFNGSNSMVTIPDSPTLRLTTAMSLEAWVNPTVTNTGWKDIIYKGNDNYYLEGATPSGRPMIGITVGATQTEAFGTSNLPPGTWTFLAATYDGTNLRFYINGTQVASQARTGPIITSSNPLQIGGDSIWGQFFQGMIDEVRVYNVALSPGQIQADMATAVGGSSPAVSLSTSSVNFGNQTVGTQSAPFPITLTNGGTVTLNISGITVTGAQAADFAQTSNCVGSVAAFANCTINVTFAPANGGVRNASISIADNAPGNPHAITLTGNGTGFSITPQTAVLTPAQTQQFTVTGAGTSSVVWLVDNIPGGSPSIGTVTSTGLYTPPSTTSTHLVTVTTSDGTKSATATAHVSANPGMFTHHNDNARTGQNLSETVLKPGNVNSASFGKIGSYTIDGIAHASPLYVANVSIPNVGVRNVVYVATEHDSAYAFDADAAGGNPLWKVSFLTGGATTVPNGDTGECCDITPEIGITGTPAIDPATGTLYVVAKTKEGTNYVQRLHALNIATGAEKFGGPVVIQASVTGTGTGSSNGTLTFNSLRENQRTALLLYNGVVYFGFGSHGDFQPYHGWLLGYNATTLQRVLTFVSTPNGEGGGIWQSGGGLAIDSSGNFFFATGDGSFSVNTGGIDYGDTFLRFNPVGGVLDYFTPHDEGNINGNNLDLDAGGMILLPDQPGAHTHLLVSAGKNGTIYVVDRDNMGHFHTTDQNVQTLDNIFPFGTPLPGNYSSPVYFNGAVYFGPVADVVQMFKLTNGLLSTSPTSTTPQAFAYPGGALAISAQGTADGILWAVRKNGASSGTLHAYDATNLAFELYNSDQAGLRDTLDAAAKFSIPLVMNGKVFVASEGRLTIYGLLP